MKKLLATIVLCVVLSSILAVSVLAAGGPVGGASDLLAGGPIGGGGISDLLAEGGRVGGVSDLLAGGLYNPLWEGAIGGG